MLDVITQSAITSIGSVKFGLQAKPAYPAAMCVSPTEICWMMYPRPDSIQKGNYESDREAIVPGVVMTYAYLYLNQRFFTPSSILHPFRCDESLDYCL